MKTVRQIQNVRGKRVIVRAELNLPIIDGQVLNDFRIRKFLPTLRFLKENGARTIIVAHIASDAGGTLEPVVPYLERVTPVKFVRDFLGTEGKETVANMEEGDVILFENIRKDKREEKNDKSLAEELSHYGDFYVNESFSTSHREHASIVGLPQYLPSFSGMLFESEFRHLSLAHNPPHPFLFILGGIKFYTKLPLAEKFLDIADRVFVGGALASAIFEKKGFAMGASVTPEKPMDLSRIVNHDNLLLPVDVCGVGFSKKPEDVKDNESILDAGPKTVAKLKEVINESAFVLWNGPIGDYKKGFTAHNNELAHIIAESSAQSVVGGGDTIASIQDLGLEDRFTFVSTAGGAMIQFLLDGTLPGIEALKQSAEKFKAY